MLSLATFALLMALGLPIAFAMIAGAVLQIVLGGNGVLLLSLPQQLFQGMESYGLLALPIFILLGELMNASGAGRRLFTLAGLATGGMRGGLAQAVLIANALMAAVLGSTVAQITLMSRLAVPEMERAGYPRDGAAALTAAGGLLAPVIPPSMLLIVYGVIAQVPIGDLFLAGIGPGLALLAVLAAITAVHNRQRAAPARAPAARTLAEALPALAIPAAMIAAILGGLATAPEAGVVAVLAVLAVGCLIYREMTPAALWPALIATIRSSASILLLIAAASLYAWVAAWENLPAMVAAQLAAVSDNPLIFLLLLNLMLLGLGMVLDPIPALILVVPVLLPVATDTYGIDPVHFGLIACLNLTIGLLTPPVGVGLYTAAMQTGVSAGRLSRLLLPYLGGALAVLAILTLVPGLALGPLTLLQ
ncbi:TRAP transporter large permease [Salipiger sp. 1_MG-2023]|uniref:TRAP transporter large permease n=1 Tax=Salipiger sp. 1_MG-2023 TaxID=3062665 RepID=UPI0026E3A571|nr:TRAP transporter large permease [Salipiger sp. 1_MG-2023]MDO6587894.1 TRAP transporter large permease [Salipiger sp. 1_MG-2023]